MSDAAVLGMQRPQMAAATESAVGMVSRLPASRAPRQPPDAESAIASRAPADLGPTSGHKLRRFDDADRERCHGDCGERDGNRFAGRVRLVAENLLREAPPINGTIPRQVPDPARDHAAKEEALRTCAPPSEVYDGP